MKSDGTGYLFQFHWQRRDHSETQFVEQGGPFTTPEQAEAWISSLAERHGPTPPDGWIPLVMDDQCEHFVRDPEPLVVTHAG